VKDTIGATTDALREAFRTCDLVITSGGVSVGEFDFVKDALAQIGGAERTDSHLDFWKVAIKPGKPFVFGSLGAKLLFGLPGNPVSAFVTFLLLVRPALLRWQGATELSLPSHPGVLAEPLENTDNRRHFIRVRTDQAGKVRPSGLQASHALLSLAKANGLVEVPPQTHLQEGAVVRVLTF
jgi:molybdopterin molybdotransferase